ncbi:hypothetical protein [Bradyrhizobium sp.]|uniref:hypothetical protein n=1 Tax=Bradyrhizobium sp. TaxID=376 RepID=UPI002731E65B|nr:hypothetical protein [Bradyrhizobium sp.]MDP1867592.1 hypothetical protein [Bradyrhizobium sp.]MDP3078723.1 hypothetical protein [Bradyrhizobium sp.]
MNTYSGIKFAMHNRLPLNGVWFMRARNSMLIAAAALAVSTGLFTAPAQAETEVRHGISMADMPGLATEWKGQDIQHLVSP